MKGYKGFDENLCCRGKQYEVGKIHHQDGEIRLCENGIHFCKSLNEVFKYYFDGRYCEVEAVGTIIEGYDKCVTSDLFIIRELSLIEVNRVRFRYGDGDGYGFGDGYGNGYGFGNGDGYGNGEGNGCGDGFGYSDRYAIQNILIFTEV